ncbi:MAG: site-specific integrase, partial [Armatimonadota bacterium]
MHHENAGNRELVERFVARYDSPNTKDGYRRDLAQFLALVGEKSLAQMTAADVAAFSSWLVFTQWRRPRSSGAYSPASVAHKLDVVRRFVRWLAAEGIADMDEAELRAATMVDRAYRRQRRHTKRGRRR